MEQTMKGKLFALPLVLLFSYFFNYLFSPLGTTKYCSYFLKGQICANVGCQFLHENGEDAEAYLKEEARLYQ